MRRFRTVKESWPEWQEQRSALAQACWQLHLRLHTHHDVLGAMTREYEVEGTGKGGLFA